jgi:acyl-lipid omega-6 desaturase (Delta-12 desaturase)
MLPEVLRDHPRLASRGRLTFLQSLRCASLAVWDERQKRLITFRELRTTRVALRPAAIMLNMIATAKPND